MPGYATEIVVHQTEEVSVTGVSLTDYADNLFTMKIYAEKNEGEDTLATACDLANSLEEATGVAWRVWDESLGLFTGVAR